MKLWAKVGKKTLWNHCKHENSSSPFLLDCSSLGIKEGKESLTTAATYTIRTGLWMLNTCMYVCLSRMWMYTNVGRVRPVLEGSLLFLFIILFLLTLCRQELLSSAGLGEGGGHELADVSPLCLDKLLCRWQRKKNKKKKTEVSLSGLRIWQLIIWWVTAAELTDITVQLFGQGRVLVKQCETLVHPLLDYMEMCVHLQITNIHF